MNEIEAPEGYEKAEDIEFEVTADKQNVEATMKEKTSEYWGSLAGDIQRKVNGVCRMADVLSVILKYNLSVKM